MVKLLYEGKYRIALVKWKLFQIHSYVCIQQEDKANGKK